MVMLLRFDAMCDVKKSKSNVTFYRHVVCFLFPNMRFLSLSVPGAETEVELHCGRGPLCGRWIFLICLFVFGQLDDKTIVYN